MAVEKWSDRIWVVRLAGEPLLSEELLGLKAELDQPGLRHAVPHLVIDLSALRLINSSNLSQLLRLRKLMVDNDRRLRLCAPADGVWAVFLTTGLDKVFDFAPDVATSLAQLQMLGR